MSHHWIHSDSSCSLMTSTFIICSQSRMNFIPIPLVHRWHPASSAVNRGWVSFRSQTAPANELKLIRNWLLVATSYQTRCSCANIQWTDHQRPPTSMAKPVSSPRASQREQKNPYCIIQHRARLGTFLVISQMFMRTKQLCSGRRRFGRREYYYPGQKKRTIIEIRGEKNAVPRVISCSIKRNQRRASPIRDCPRLLPCADRAWSSMISHVEQRSSRRESRGWFFFFVQGSSCLPQVRAKLICWAHVPAFKHISYEGWFHETGRIYMISMPADDDGQPVCVSSHSATRRHEFFTCESDWLRECTTFESIMAWLFQIDLTSGATLKCA